MHVYGLGDEWALFLKKKSLTPASAGPKSVLEQMGAFSMYVCGLGDVVALFLEERKADTLLRLRGARSRFEEPIGSFSIYVCGLGDVRA